MHSVLNFLITVLHTAKSEIKYCGPKYGKHSLSLITS